jgi:SAP domain-containing ribonucleoprotein
MSTSLDPSKLKVAELRQELQARGLDTKGNKPDLVERLTAALAAGKVQVQTSAPEAANGTQTQQPATTTNTESTAVAPPPQQPPRPQDAQTQQQQSQPQQTSQDQSTSPQTEDIDLSQLSEAERRKRRAERFGIPISVSVSEQDKKKLRAERFGLTAAGAVGLKSTKADEEQKKREARAKRFGTTSTQTQGQEAQATIAPAQLTRAQRLGLPVKEAATINTKALPPVNDPSRLKARQERFGAVETSDVVCSPPQSEEEKKKKRAERFAVAGNAVEAKRLRVDKPLEQQTKA